MAFDKSLDKQLFAETYEGETTKLTVAVFSYNDGAAKLQISRENRSQDGEWKWSKMGRLFKEEAEAIMPLMQKAIDSMQ